ncbi:hypothetical protein Ancab_004241 [Ancistrocladus abbreviatus]
MEGCNDPIAAKQQAVNLLEDSWFFGNSLLTRKSRMVRCNSDPSPSATTKEDTLLFNAKGNNKINAWHRTPSLPPSSVGEEVEDEEELRMGDLIRQAMPVVRSGRSGNRLARAPSLQPCKGEEEEEGGGVSRSGAISLPEKGSQVSKLTRRASIDSSIINALPPRHSSKGPKESSSVALRSTKPQTKDKMLTINTRLNKDVKPRNFNRSKSMKSVSDQREDLSPSVVDIPGLRIKEKGVKEEVEKVRRRPYLSEAWHTAPIPNGVDKGSTEDMKAQIKFWARAVASNVRQEC